MLLVKASGLAAKQRAVEQEGKEEGTAFMWALRGATDAKDSIHEPEEKGLPGAGGKFF